MKSKCEACNSMKLENGLCSNRNCQNSPRIWKKWNDIPFRLTNNSIDQQETDVQPSEGKASKADYIPKEYIQYVDESGNHLDPNNINFENVTFTDEFGRPTDREGKLLNQTLPEDETLKVAENLFRAGCYSDLIEFCQQNSDLYPQNAALWRLMGCALGAMGRAKSARRAFKCAFEIEPTDALTLVNYITSCFDADDKVAGLQAIKSFFRELDGDGKKLVLDSLNEAIRSGLVLRKDLPISIIDLMKKDTDGRPKKERKRRAS